MQLFPNIVFNPMTIAPPLLILCAGALCVIGHFVKGYQWTDNTQLPRRETWITLWNSYTCYITTAKTCVLSGVTERTFDANDNCSTLQDIFGATELLAIVSATLSFFFFVIALWLIVYQNVLSVRRVGVYGMICMVVLILVTGATAGLYLSMYWKRCLNQHGPMWRPGPFMYVGALFFAILAFIVYALHLCWSDDEVVTTETPAARSAHPAGVETTDVIPEGNDWETTRTPDLYWSNSNSLFWDRTSTHYYDPRSGKWYSTEEKRWYAL